MSVPSKTGPVTTADSSSAGGPGRRSIALFKRALKHLPGGNSRTTLFVPPSPPYALKGIGYLLSDVDGRQLIDLQNNYTSLIHGHAHPDVVAEAKRAIRDGASFGLPTEGEIKWAETLSARIPWAEQWRFANSGTEAVMLAMRLARAVTGRDAVMRFDGAYHGTYDGALMPGARGVPEAMATEIVSVPFGDIEVAGNALEEHGSRLACVLLDSMPNRAGLRPASQEFVTRLRDETRERGILLLHDEVLCFRLAYGGLHSLYGIEPDVIILGKIIGGGFPVGAVGARSEVMDLLDPRRPDALPHGGTFSANPVTVRAGIEALRLYDQAEVERLNQMGDGLRQRLQQQGWEVTGKGSLLRLHVEDPTELWWRLYHEGLLAAGNGLLCLSTPMDEDVIEQVVGRLGRCRN